jgi:hypothetical protein
MKERLKTVWKNHKAAIVALAAALVGSLLTYLGVPPATVTVIERVLVPVLVEAPGDPPPDVGMGWAAAETLDVKVFADTPAGRATELPSSVYLWKAHLQLMGHLPPPRDQNPTGSCVGFGTTRAIERSLVTQILATGGHKSEFSYFSEEVTYAGSRYEANGNRPPRFRGDGSNGGWAARFVTEWGMVPKAKYEGHDLTEYSASRARSWNNTGVPDSLEPVARKFPVKSAARITTWHNAKKALASGYGIQIASSMAVGRQRDANGVAQARGSWAHSMCLDGYHTDTDGREYGHVENSWSQVNYHVGPVGWGEPTTAGFWVESSVIDRALREGDSYAYSGATGFPRRNVDDWLIRAEPARPLRLLEEPLFALSP